MEEVFTIMRRFL